MGTDLVCGPLKSWIDSANDRLKNKRLDVGQASKENGA